MTINNGIMWMLIMCMIVLTIVFFKNKLELFINFMLRAIVGITGLYFMNLFLSGQGLLMTVGINPITVSAVGVLGLPGFVMLYGISFYNTL